MFDELSQRFEDAVKSLRGQAAISETNVEGALKEVRRALLEADVSLPVVREFVEEVRRRAVGTEVVRGISPDQKFIQVVHEQLVETMGGENAPLASGGAAGHPAVVLMAGLQGAGKTTATAKLGLHLKEKGRKALLVAADVYRPAAIDQLQTLGRQIGVEVLSHVVQLGAARVSDTAARPGRGDLDRIDASEVRCFDPAAEAAMVAEIKAAAKEGDSLGGVVEVLAYGCPPGLGSHVHWDRRLDGLLAQALMSIQAMKGVEIGEGFTVAGVRGSVAHDAIHWDTEAGYVRESARAGGIEGGMSTGEVIVARVAMKPLATLNRPVLATVDVVTKESTVSFKERTDVTAVPAAGVVGETMAALVLAQEALRKFGGDSLDEFLRNHRGYVEALDRT